MRCSPPRRRGAGAIFPILFLAGSLHAQAAGAAPLVAHLAEAFFPAEEMPVRAQDGSGPVRSQAATIDRAARLAGPVDLGAGAVRRNETNPYVPRGVGTFQGRLQRP